VFTGGDPVLLGARVDLEDVGPGAEDGLLPVRRRRRRRRRRREEAERGKLFVSIQASTLWVKL